MPPTLKPAITFAEKKDLDPVKLVRLYQQAPSAKGRTLEDAREMLRHTDVAVTACISSTWLRTVKSGSRLRCRADNVSVMDCCT